MITVEVFVPAGIQAFNVGITHDARVRYSLTIAEEPNDGGITMSNTVYTETESRIVGLFSADSTEQRKIATLTIPNPLPTDAPIHGIVNELRSTNADFKGAVVLVVRS